jgi:acyl-CoA synthetase (AMP-forming)/AMP-acid ligase II
LFTWATDAFGSQELSVLGDDRIIYREAERRSGELARALFAAGIGKGARVGVLAPNGPDLSVVLMAITRMGAVAVPINTFYMPAELGWVLSDSAIQLLITVPSLLSNDYVTRLEAAMPSLAGARDSALEIETHPFLRAVHVLGGCDRAWAAPLDRSAPASLLRAAEASVYPADDQLVIYTSGSTARPKGVVHVHAATIEQSWFIANQQRWSPEDRIYMPLPYFWIGGFVYGFLAAMEMGATTLCELRLEPASTLRYLEREHATVTMGWPHIGPTLAGHPDFASTDLSRLRGPYHQELLSPDRRVPDPTLLVNPLGMTETATAHTWWDPWIPLSEDKRGSLGTDAPGWEHKIVDESRGIVPDGTVGEICVRGVGLMRGIIGHERRDVFDVDGWYHTGDSGYRDAEGHLYFLGRTGELIKTAGASVSPVEVQAVLQAMPEIWEAAVIGLPDQIVGQVVCGVVVFQPGTTVEDHELVRRCRTALAAYKVPKRWVVLEHDELPFTASDKVDKARLIEQLAPSLDRSSADR